MKPTPSQNTVTRTTEGHILEITKGYRYIDFSDIRPIGGRNEQLRGTAGRAS
jgi:hypothetical protein